jgi:uncharacterized protein YukE
MSWYITQVRRRFRVLALVAGAGLVVAVGAASAVSSRTTVAPANSSPPTISGNATVGSTVTANPGTWSGSTPITFQYQWQICGANGEACHNIAGATAQSYVIRNEDAGNTLRVRVIGSNSDGSSSATSGPTARIGGSTAPADSSPPTISGNTSVGSTLTASPGTWTGAAPMTFHYQWMICGSNGEACHDIAGATAQSYVVRSGDAGNTLRVRVTATNSGGSTSSTSVPTARLGAAAPAPAPTGCPKTAAGAQAVTVTDVASPARLQIDQFQLASGPITRGMTSFQVRFHVSDTCGQAVQGAQVYVTAVPYDQVSIPSETATDGSGWTTLTFNRQAGFPASRNQELMVLFVRARRAGDPLLGGISTRRLISLPVHLGR